MKNSPQTPRIPPLALAISVAAFAIPVGTVYWLPESTSNGLGMFIWLTVLLPVILLAHYRGVKGVAGAWAGGMAVMTVTQVGVVASRIAVPNWTLLLVIVSIDVAVSLGIATLAEALRRARFAGIDQLTGLPNRHQLEVTLAREFAAAGRGQSLTVVIFDLDQFKHVRDLHGHAAGNMALKALAKILRTTTRLENLSARFDSERFIAVLRCRPESAVIYAQRVLDQMRTWQAPWGVQTVSAGVAGYQQGMGSYEVLLAEADRALYQAEEGGRDMVCTAPPYEQPGTTAATRDSVPLTDLPNEAAAAKPVSATIWIVDDDSAVRSLVKRMLIRHEHKLWDTGDPLEAILRFGDASPDHRPDVILTDVMMPAMSGVRMIDQIAKIDPAIKVIYMSGYMQSAMQERQSPGAVVAVLEKPIAIGALLDTVQRVIGTAPAQPPP